MYMLSNVLTLVSLGDFTINSSKILVSDPCLNVDHIYDNYELSNVRSGNWESSIFIGEIDSEQPKDHIFELIAIHSDHAQNPLSHIWIIATDRLKSITGQLGIYDSKYYKDDSVISSNFKFKPSFGPQSTDEKGDLWFGMNSTVTSNNLNAGTIPYGVVSKSGKGPGNYELYIAKDSQNKIIGIKLQFIDEDSFFGEIY